MARYKYGTCGFHGAHTAHAAGAAHTLAPTATTAGAVQHKHMPKRETALEVVNTVFIAVRTSNRSIGCRSSGDSTANSYTANGENCERGTKKTQPSREDGDEWCTHKKNDDDGD